MQSGAERARGPKHFVPGPQNFVAGIALLALALFALWLTSELPQGTLRAMGPAMLPRWLAIGVGMCGVALAVMGMLKPGDALESVTFRGPIFVVLGILAFAATIRGIGLGPLNIPGLGLIIAGPLAIFIGGLATPEVRFRELLILALALTAFCMVLFGDLLNLPIPLFPQWLSDLYPVGWSNDLRMRSTAGVLVLLAVAVYLSGHNSRRRERIDVADHSSVPGQRGRV